MKIFIAFIVCFFCSTVEMSAIYGVEKQGVSMPQAVVSTPKKLTYKERVALKYLKFKAKVAKTYQATRGFAVAAALFLIIGIVLTASSNRSNQSGGIVDKGEGCLTSLLAIVAFVISGVLFIAAAVAAI